MKINIFKGVFKIKQIVIINTILYIIPRTIRGAFPAIPTIA
jgi:hypothetical protein